MTENGNEALVFLFSWPFVKEGAAGGHAWTVVIIAENRLQLREEQNANTQKKTVWLGGN